MWAKVLKKYGRKWGRIGGFFWGMHYSICGLFLCLVIVFRSSFKKKLDFFWIYKINFLFLGK